MTRDDILALARAGFSRAEIAAFAQAAPVAPPAPAAPATPAAPAAPPALAAPPAPAAPAAAAAPEINTLLQRLGVLTDTLQSSALLQTQQPAPETADDILARIIAPPIKKEVS